MDAFLICPETRKSFWLGKPVRVTDANDVQRTLYYHRGPSGSRANHESELLNKVLWKFLADHAHKDLKIVFDGEYDDDMYERIGSDEAETEEYLRGWPERS